MLNYKKTVKKTTTKDSFIVLLDYGLCALVDLNKRHVEVELVISSFFGSGSFEDIDKIDTDTEERIISVLKKPEKIIYSSNAEEYLSNPEFKKEIDGKLKDFGFDETYNSL